MNNKITLNKMIFKRNMIWLSLFAIAMAHVEAVLVVHLRTIYYPANPLNIFPLELMSHRDLGIEIAREFFTVMMILAVAVLAEKEAGKGFTRIFAAFVFIFGLWDIFYYVWLKIMIGWPVSWFEWDVLFLIPWPWFGPWIAPLLIALLFALWGGWVLLMKNDVRFTRGTALLFILGVILALVAFLQPAVPLLVEGEEAFRHFQPDGFLWRFYIAGYLLMVYSLWRVIRRDLNRQTNDQSKLY